MFERKKKTATEETTETAPTPTIELLRELQASRTEAESLRRELADAKAECDRRKGDGYSMQIKNEELKAEVKRLSAALEKPRIPDADEETVFAVGYTKTGTGRYVARFIATTGSTVVERRDISTAPREWTWLAEDLKVAFARLMLAKSRGVEGKPADLVCKNANALY